MAGWRVRAGEWAGDAGRAFAVARRSPSLGRAELAFGAMCIAEGAFTVGLGVLAFEDGGASRVGLVAAVRLLPAALLAPVASALADRWPRERVLTLSSALLGASMIASALVLAAGGPVAVVYAFAAVASIALTPYRAAHTALLPSLCHTTDELAASNIVRGVLESLSAIVGPLTAAALIGVSELWTVFAVTAVAAGAAALLLVRLPYERPPPLSAATHTRLSEEIVEGLRAAAANRDARTLIALAAAQTFLRGCLNVFTVVLAIDVLHTGDSGVGVLQAAVGVGAVVGAIGAARLVGARRMAAWFGAGVAMWGVPICVIGGLPSYAPTLAMLTVIGVANAVLDVGLFTMLGRFVADDVLARVLGVFETVVAATVGLGSVAAAVAINLIGIRPAMVVLGSVAPIAVAYAWSRLNRLDASLGVRQCELDVLQQVPMLRTLPVPTIEHLARRLKARELLPGHAIIREGTLGSRFYVIADGTVEVREQGRLLRTMGPGEGFGEISLLRGVRRTATVTATSAGPVALYAIARDDFVFAVGGYPRAATAADETIAAWQALTRASRRS